MKPCEPTNNDQATVLLVELKWPTEVQTGLTWIWSHPQEWNPHGLSLAPWNKQLNKNVSNDSKKKRSYKRQIAVVFTAIIHFFQSKWHVTSFN